jgi:hypothetical protein
MEILARCLVEAPKDSRLVDGLEEAIENLRPADEELVTEIKKLDDIGRKNVSGKDR